MTQHFTVLTPRYVLQVSDRLLTQRTRAFDARSNKNIVYEASNGIITMAYSGPAYLEGVPTDRWITEKLHGKPLVDFAPGQPFTHKTGRAPQWLDVGSCIEVLRREVRRVYNSSRKPDRDLEVVLAGWQWKPRQEELRVRPVECELEACVDGTEPLVSWAPRYWHLDHTRGYPLLVSSIPSSSHLSGKQHQRSSHLSRQQHEQVDQALRYVGYYPESALELLVAAVRQAASNKPRIVGEDCMCVYMSPGDRGLIHVWHLPSQGDQRVTVSAGGARSSFAPTYSPWILGRDVVRAPSVQSESFKEALTQVTVVVHGPEAEFRREGGSGARLLGFMDSQRRPDDPTRSSIGKAS